MKNFEQFVESGIIKKISPDRSKARDLLEESERKERSLKKVISFIHLSEENANDIIEFCYDIVMYLIRAILYLEGFKSFGEGSHEAEISYLKKRGFSEAEINFINEMRFFRNGIKYYGKRLEKEYAEKVLSFSGKIIPRLKKLLKI